MTGNKPTHLLMVVSKKNTRDKTCAGAVWLNEEGFGSVKLRPGVVLREQDSDRYWLNLVGNNQEHPAQMGPKPLGSEGAPDDDITF